MSLFLHLSTHLKLTPRSINKNLCTPVFPNYYHYILLKPYKCGGIGGARLTRVLVAAEHAEWDCLSHC